jgi:hypothetical protein
MPSSLLSAIIGFSMILSGHSHHGFLLPMKGEYQENNRLQGVEFSTNFKDPNPLWKFLDLCGLHVNINNTKSSFYYKNFINSNYGPSESVGVNVEF